jgi:DNA-directed RNA polymerase subunit M/transcription elongation factor TFIIS
MDSSSEVARELSTLKTETAKQYKELKKEIEELRVAQAEILGRLRSEDRQPAPEGKTSASRTRRHERGLETFCPECLGLQLMVEQRSVRMADGSPATAGECSTCGTMLFRMTTMSGTLATEDGASHP